MSSSIKQYPNFNKKFSIKQGGHSSLLGIKVSLCNGHESPMFKGDETNEEVRESIPLEGFNIGHVGLKVQKYPDGDQCYYGIRLKNRQGTIITSDEWGPAGKWEY